MGPGLPGDRRGGRGALHLSSDKARQVLGWRPRWGFPETVEKTVAWYRGFLDGEDPLRLTEAQVREYMEGWR
jgi:CDP-glucose 4,6-dehydratase